MPKDNQITEQEEQAVKLRGRVEKANFPNVITGISDASALTDAFKALAPAGESGSHSNAFLRGVYDECQRIMDPQGDCL